MIWPFPLIRSHGTNSDLSALFLAFANAPGVIVEPKKEAFGRSYYATATCHLGTLEFWTANRDYGWAHRGSFEDTQGNVTKWDKEMPSRWAVKQMAKLVDEAKNGKKFKWENRVPVPAQIARAVGGSTHFTDYIR